MAFSALRDRNDYLRLSTRLSFMNMKTIKLHIKLPGRRFLIYLLLPALVCTPWTVFANAIGIGSRQVASAWNINQGALQFSTWERFYAKHQVVSGDEGTTTGFMVWDSQLSAMISYGLTRFLQIDAAPIILQSTHLSDPRTDSPGDLFISAKWKALSLLPSLRTALQMDVQLPLAQHHNIPLNPYSADKAGFGATALISWKVIGATPEKGLMLDTNIGYFNYNDAGAHLTDSPADSFSQTTVSQQVRLGAALRWMGQQYGVYSEIVRYHYLTPPPPTAYSRENCTYSSSGMLYQFNPYILVTLGVDLLLAGRNDDTRYEINGESLLDASWQTAPNYPDWRLNLGLTFSLGKGRAAEPKVKDDKPEKSIAATPDAKQKEEPKAKADKKVKKNTAAGSGEEKTTLDITDVKELERRLKAQKEQTAETPKEREERMLQERERMGELLKRLREKLESEAAKKEQAAAEQKKIKEQQELEKLKQKAEAEAPKPDAEAAPSEDKTLDQPPEPGAESAPAEDKSPSQTPEPGVESSLAEDKTPDQTPENSSESTQAPNQEQPSPNPSEEKKSVE
jgi:hypothetical protein